MTNPVIIDVGVHAAWWVRAAAHTALVLHVGGGSAGLISGGISMGAPKGGRLHRTAGRVFVGSMLVMAAMAAITAPFTQRQGNVVGGVFTFYLVLTGWQTIRRPTGQAGWFEAASGLAAVAVAVGAWCTDWLLDHGPSTTADDQSAGPAYILGGVALLAGVLDLRVARRGSLSAMQRLTRHLWRMCVAVFIAAGSFFLGQQLVFPAFMQGSLFLMIPVLAPLFLMVFWQGKTRFFRASNAVQTAQANGLSLHDPNLSLMKMRLIQCPPVTSAMADGATLAKTRLYSKGTTPVGLE